MHPDVFARSNPFFSRDPGGEYQQPDKVQEAITKQLLSAARDSVAHANPEAFAVFNALTAGLLTQRGFESALCAFFPGAGVRRPPIFGRTRVPVPSSVRPDDMGGSGVLVVVLSPQTTLKK